MKSNPNELKIACSWRRGVILIAATLGLVACGEKPGSPVPETAPAKLFQQERDALDRAKGVEQTEAQHVEDLKREEEKQTQ